MTTTLDSTDTEKPPRLGRREKIFLGVNKAAIYLNVIGLGWLVPLIKIVAGDNPRHQLRELGNVFFVPLTGIALFLLLWGTLAPLVDTSLGKVPGPAQVWEQTVVLWESHLREREKAAAFYERQELRNDKLIAAGRGDEAKLRTYTGTPTFLDQIGTSLKTVAFGFLIATLVAVPLGVVCGLSRSVNAGLNPLIQIFKPVSPLAWLPIVTMIVSATYIDPYEWLPKSLLISAITVTLCSLWPTLINTTFGVAAVDKDLMNVGRVLKLSTAKTLTKLVLPSAMPVIFTGMRVSLGVGWMVLIASEMLAQNPGLGKFVWDEFQNGSSSSLANIMVAVLAIGIIGFLLDRLMYALQTAFASAAAR